MQIRNKATNTVFFASSNFFSEKLLPRKRSTPAGMPILAITETIPANEIKVEVIPIVSLVVILDMIIQKMLPEINEAIVSM